MHTEKSDPTQIHTAIYSILINNKWKIMKNFAMVNYCFPLPSNILGRHLTSANQQHSNDNLFFHITTNMLQGVLRDYRIVKSSIKRLKVW